MEGENSSYGDATPARASWRGKQLADSIGRVPTGRTIGGIGPVAKVRVNMTYAGGEVMFNSDLIFLAGIPIVVLAWEQRPHGDYPAVTVTLDPKHLQQIDWPDADYLYKLSVEDPRVVVSESEIAAKGTQLLEQSSPPMPEDVREAFRDAVHLYVDCKLGSPERSISFRRLQRISLSGVCDLVLGYRNEPLPLDIHCELLNLVDETHADLKVELARDPSYEAGARILLKLIDDQKPRERPQEGFPRPFHYVS
jgi:hypothetical protein